MIPYIALQHKALCTSNLISPCASPAFTPSQPMSLTPDQVRRIAHLARIETSAKRRVPDHPRVTSTAFSPLIEDRCRPSIHARGSNPWPTPRTWPSACADDVVSEEATAAPPSRPWRRKPKPGSTWCPRSSNRPVRSCRARLASRPVPCPRLAPYRPCSIPALKELAAGPGRARQISSVELTTAVSGPHQPAQPGQSTPTSPRSSREKRSLKAAGQGGRRPPCRRATFGPLTGIPLAQKDIFCAEGWLTTCGSKMLANFVAPYDADGDPESSTPRPAP